MSEQSERKERGLIIAAKTRINCSHSFADIGAGNLNIASTPEPNGIV